MNLYQGPRGGFYYKKGGKKIYIGKGIGQSKSISIDEKIPKSIQDLFDEEERLEKEELKKKINLKKISLQGLYLHLYLYQEFYLNIQNLVLNH